jgi:hypothetical protein
MTLRIITDWIMELTIKTLNNNSQYNGTQNTLRKRNTQHNDTQNNELVCAECDYTEWRHEYHKHTCNL